MPAHEKDSFLKEFFVRPISNDIIRFSNKKQYFYASVIQLLLAQVGNIVFS